MKNIIITLWTILIYTNMNNKNVNTYSCDGYKIQLKVIQIIGIYLMWILKYYNDSKVDKYSCDCNQYYKKIQNKIWIKWIYWNMIL